MATRADIIVQCADGDFKKIYSHWDGYIEGVGATLLTHYNSQELAEAIVNHGDISSLYETIEKSEFYGRDRGEDDVEAKVYSSFEKAVHPAHGRNEYTYVWKDGTWVVASRHFNHVKFIPLCAAVAGNNEPPAPAEKPFFVGYPK